MLYVKPERIKRETEKAYLLQCPASHYSYARATFWMSKSQARLCRYGDTNYLQVNFPSEGKVELKRFISKRQPPQVFQVEWSEMMSMFRADHDLVWMRLQYEHRALEADRLFEQQMREY